MRGTRDPDGAGCPGAGRRRRRSRTARRRHAAIAAAARVRHAGLRLHVTYGQRRWPRPGPLLEIARRAVGRLARGSSSRFKEAEIRNPLMAAGLYTTAPMTFLGYRVLGTALAPPARWSGSSRPRESRWMLCSPRPRRRPRAGSLPMTIVRRRAEPRVEQVETDLPELIDLLVVTVEAGLAEPLAPGGLRALPRAAPPTSCG